MYSFFFQDLLNWRMNFHIAADHQRAAEMLYSLCVTVLYANLYFVVSIFCIRF